MKLDKKASVSIFFIIVLSFVLYRPSLKTYFFQDDWFSIRIANATSPEGLFSFFIPRSDVIYYRPLGMQIPFFLLTKFFGLNPFPFHLVSFLIHAVNILLVYVSIKLLTRRGDLSLLTAFFYGTSTIHFIPFFWASTISFPLALTFTLLTIISYLYWVNNNRSKILLIGHFLQFIALLTNEIAVLIPLIVGVHMFIYKKLNAKVFITLSILPALYTMLRVLYLPKLTNTYNLEVGKKTLYALATYVLWLFNWPEEIRNQLENIIARNYSYFTAFPVLNGLLFLYMLIVGSFLLYYIVKDAKRKKGRDTFLFFLIVGIISLILPLLFPNHTYPYYLLIPMIALGTLIALSTLSITSQTKYPLNRISVGLICVLWLYTSITSLEFSQHNHWAPTRARISEVVVQDMLKKYPKINASQKVFIHNDPYLKVILSNQDAFKVVYNREVKTIYEGKEDPLWKNTSDDNPVEQQIRLKWDYVR